MSVFTESFIQLPQLLQDGITKRYNSIKQRIGDYVSFYKAFYTIPTTVPGWYQYQYYLKGCPPNALGAVFVPDVKSCSRDVYSYFFLCLFTTYVQQTNTFFQVLPWPVKRMHSGMRDLRFLPEFRGGGGGGAFSGWEIMHFL